MFFKKKEKVITDTYSQFGIPGHNFITTDCRIRVIIDPPKDYFGKKLKKDKKNYDKLLLIHGAETPDLNNIKKEVLEFGNEFDKICSFDQEVVDKYKHAELFCFGSSWVLTNNKGDVIGMKEDYSPSFEPKTNFKLSFIRSSKKELPGHKLRYEIESIIKDKYPFELFFPETRIENKLPLFNDSMFHLTIENSRYPNYITEKVIDCFMSYTIPIYWGCPNIGEHFDMNGIITFEDKEQLKSILNDLTPQMYTDRLEAVKKNYEIAKEKFAFFFDNVNTVISKM